MASLAMDGLMRSMSYWLEQALTTKTLYDRANKERLLIKRVSDARKQNQGGFTLIELLVVIVILGILSAVVVFAVQGAGDRGRLAATNIDATTLRGAEERFCLSFGRYGSASELVTPPWPADAPDKRGFIQTLPTLNQPAVYTAGRPGMPASSPCGSASGTNYPTGFTICGDAGCGQTAPPAPTYEASPALTLNTSVATPDAGRMFGRKMIEVGADLNNPPDGVKDVWVHGQTSSNAGNSQVYALSGADLAKGVMTRLYTITRLNSGDNRFSGNTMQEMTTLTDVNGDAKPDLALATPGTGTVSVNDGATGVQIRTLTRPGTSGFGFGEVGSAGDINGDNATDIAVGDAADGVNKVHIYSGADGSVLRSITNPDPSCTTTSCFGTFVQSPGDVDLALGGAWELLVGGNNRMWLFSGADGALLLTIDRPPLPDGTSYAPPAPSFGSAYDIAPNSPGDVTGDGKADLYVAAQREYGPAGACEGRAWVFDGGASVANPTSPPEVEYMLTDPALLGFKNFGKSMASVDVNGDNKKDLFVGSDAQNPCSPLASEGIDRNGGTALFDGATGQVLKVLSVPDAVRQPWKAQGCSSSELPVSLGRSVAAPGDLDGDGQEDLVAAGPWYNSRCSGTTLFDQGTVVTYATDPG